MTPGRQLRFSVAGHIARINAMSAYGTVAVSLIVVVGFFGVVFFLLIRPLGELSDTMNTIMNILIGALVGNFVSVVNYWIGSSAGSARKDAAMPEHPKPATGAVP